MGRSIRILLATGLLAASALGAVALRAGDSQVHPGPGLPGGRNLLHRLPLTFIENRGQMDPRATYYVEGAGASVYFTPNGVGLSARLETRNPADLHMEFPGASTVPPIAEDRTSAVISDFSAPGDGAEGLPTYSQVTYQDLWPGIDLEFSGTSSRLKYQFVVEPGADPGRISLTWDGSDGLAVNDRGQLEIATPSGILIDDTPVSYQLVNGSRTEVPTEYSVAKGGVGFELGAYDPSRPLVIDPALLLYAGYIGGAGSDDARGVAVDASGNTYVTGQTLSDQTTFPDGDGFGTVPGFDQTFNGGFIDAFVAKINAAGTTLLYATYIGGSGFDGGRSIAVDASGNAYVAGFTTSDNTTFPDGDPDTNDTFPAPGFDQTHNGSEDAFVAKIDAAGTDLEYATYIGGAADDRANQIRVDGSGNAYVTGRTDSDEATFPDGTDSGGGPDAFDGIPGPDQTFNGIRDAFVAKVGPAGTAVSYAGYVGGAGVDQGFGIIPLPSGNAAVTGWTDADEATFPDGTDDGGDGNAFDGIPGPDQIYNGGGDAFVAQINAAGTALVSAGYIGGNDADYGFGIGVDAQGNSAVTGYTQSTETTFPDGDDNADDTFPVPGFDQVHNGSGDAFVAKMNPAGSALVYAGYIGGSGTDNGFGIAVDGAGNAFVTGETSSDETTFPDGDPDGNDTFPVPGPDQTYNDSGDAFVAKVNPAGTALVYAGYIGGESTDPGYEITVDSAGNAYIAGQTGSDQTTFPDGDDDADDLFPVPGFDQTHNSGTNDGFVAKIEAFPLPAPTPTPTPTPISATCKGKAATVVGTAAGETLTGTSGRDVVAARGGNDRIKTQGGNDLVCAGDGRDTANGGAGRDKLFGEDGKDNLKGSVGKDTLNGGQGNDTCVGGAGSDKAPGCETEKSID